MKQYKIKFIDGDIFTYVGKIDIGSKYIRCFNDKCKEICVAPMKHIKYIIIEDFDTNTEYVDLSQKVI